VYFPSEQDDAALVQQTLGGDQAAFEGLVQRYQKVLYTVALRMLGNPDDAKDATQTAFVRAYERLGTFDEQYKFFSWIYRILMNECLNVLRGRHPEDELSPALAIAGGQYEAAMSSERREQIQAALLQLTPDHRAVIVLRYLLEYTPGEIADLLDLPRGTVNSRLRRGLDKLKERLE